jgi:hypothetical protein
MVFDMRGRRRHVVQVVYALLAFIMAASLFFVVGPVDLGSFIGGGSSGSSSAAFEDQAQAIDRKLAKDPRNEQLLLRDVKAWSTAGRAQIQTDPNTGQTLGFTQDALDDFGRAGDAWLRYVKVADDPNPNVAQQAATALLYSGATSNAAEFVPTIKGAAEAQRIYAEARPSANAFLTLAQYEYFAGNFAAGDEAGKKAKQEAPSTQASVVDQAVAQYRKQGEAIAKQLKAAAKAAKGSPGAGEQALQSPLGGLSGGGSGTGLPAQP